ncbi:hypothetical protein M899_0369 [Bacteriovorax sp. BSW11_IV]|uniref:hypothetical protein n=1 Tax=Bacteriovorax sp. BSW11_IV TaxID=1353529 RepID=UPI00038A3104|nr:hypothetical protein [Bacteriovorax sp. BSW11_IV]EQC43079.1 hypothetical protein M899_0369 [Bacteriovorax sp. BSW11_IV]
MKKLLLLMTLFHLSGCSSKPVLYPNARYKAMGKESANQQIENCMKEGDDFMESPKAKKILGTASKGAAVGGAVGVVSGIIRGDWLEGLLSGAAIGGAAGAASGAVAPDRLKQAYVNRCLREKGLDVIGWD